MNHLSTKPLMMVSLFCASFLLSGCGDDIAEEVVNPKVETEEGICWTRPEQKLVVNLPQGGEEATRVVLVDSKLTGGSGVKSEWETTDRLGVWNVTAAAGGQNGYNTVNPASKSRRTNFTGTVNCSKGDKIAVFYPYGNGTGVTASASGILTLDLQEQGGTLDDIAKKYGLIYGEATVSGVANGEASASLGTLTPGISIFEFQFKDGDSNTQLEFERVQIQIEGGHNRATLNLNNIAGGLTMTGGNTFDIRPASPVNKIYVALFGETGGKTLRFSIIDQHGFQHKASATAPASVTTGQITRANLKAKDGDFIEIDGTRFAKGNLIWDEGSVADAERVGRRELERSLRRDSYFIAPSQEWSPEQLTNPRLGNFVPVWPAAAPQHQSGIDEIYTVPNPSANNFYISTFLWGIAGLNGVTPGLGYIVSGTASTGGNLTILTIQKTFDDDTPYQGELWGNTYLDEPVPLSDALNAENQTRSYFGDQAYLATGGRCAMPTVEDLRKVFEHPNAVWAVIPVNKNGQNNIKPLAGSKGVGVPANSDYYNMNPDILPIYGLYVDKTRTYEQMKQNGLYTGTEWGDRKVFRQKTEYFAYKGCAVILTEEDLKRGIFLPADGVRNGKASSGGFEFVTGFMGGEYCSYLTATFGKGSIQNSRQWTARADNHGQYGTWGDDNEPDVKIEFKKEERTTTGSIRPVYIGDIYQ